jgi:DNA-binding LacI/PurR family transcriptional regulator
MPYRAVSIQDIAREAGVSHATVSRALHDSHLISSEVRAHIQQLAREMGYTPNAVAQSLKGQHTNTVGLLVTSIADPYYGRVVRGVEEVAQSAGLDLFLGVSNNDSAQEMAVVRSFHRRRVDGIITASSRLSDEQLAELTGYAVPAVLLNRQSDGQSDLVRSVYVDDYVGARLAMSHLLELGHRAIGYAGSSVRPRSNRIRRQGYLDALAGAGIMICDGWVQIGAEDLRYYTDDVAAGGHLMLQALRAGVTAVFCYNDMYAVGALMTCRELGLDVPDQVSIIGFDGVELAQYVTPPITTIHQPKLRLGQLAMEMLLQLMEGKPVDDHVLLPELLVRCSTSFAPPAPVKIAPDVDLSGRLPCISSS